MNTVLNPRDDYDAPYANFVLGLETTATRAGPVSVAKSGAPSRRDQTPKRIENAVYGYIQAVRALGRERISTSEIASALAIPISSVAGAIDALKEKGVKIAK